MKYEHQMGEYILALRREFPDLADKNIPFPIKLNFR